MNARLRYLRRRTAPARAHLALEQLSDDFCSRWYDAAINGQPLPDENDFIRQVVAAGFRLPTFNAVRTYLENCRRQNINPDPKELFRQVLPWPPMSF